MYLFTAGIRDDVEKVIVSMGFIEGRAQDQMRDYWDNFQTRQVIPTWPDFLARMSNIFRTVQPEIRAREKLDEIAEKHAKNFGKFAEEFTVPAINSKFSDIDLIHRINLALDSVTKATITSVRLSNPQQVPTQWNEYLQWALNAYKHTWTKKESTSVNALSTSNDKKKKPKDKKDLTKEQIVWIEKGLCANGGQHPYKFKEKCTCKNPPYQGPYNLPWCKKDVRSMDQDEEDDDDTITKPATRGEEVAVVASISPAKMAEFQEWKNAQATSTTMVPLNFL
jgi:hypothetical protein